MRIVALALLVFSFSASAAQECLAHLPYGQPKSARTDTTLICREGYALEHDNKAKIPAWVAYTLTPASAVGCEERASSFKPEPRLPRGKRAELKDYAKSGYDIGHMANSADMRSSDQLSSDSNILSNATPQLPGLNRVAWKSLEIKTRSWAVGRENNILVYVGPVYDSKAPTTIGKNRVTVPTAFYKVLIDQVTEEALAFLYPHEASRAPPQTFITSVAEVQRQIGFTLPIPQNIRFSKTMWDGAASAVKLKSRTCPLK